MWHSVNCSLLRKGHCCGKGFKMKSGFRWEISLLGSLWVLEQLVTADFFLLCGPCCWIVVLLVINCSVTEILTQALGDTAVELADWALITVGLFQHYQKAERKKNHQYLLKLWPKPKIGGRRPDAHTNVMVKHLIGFGGILLFSRLILLVLL